MKAILLAAGLGTRLRPVTDHLPKCLVPVAGRPLLDWWLDLLETHGVRDLLINLHHLPDVVRRHLAEYRGGVRVHTVMEPELLGSAGTILANRDFVADCEQFLVLYADNLTNANLTELVEFNRANPAPLTVGLFRAESPSDCGIASLDEQGVIVEFVEKPIAPKSDLASAGLFVARPALFDHLLSPELHPEQRPYDFGRHVMPSLVGRMNGLLVSGYLRDVGTPQSLARAEAEWKRLQAPSPVRNRDFF